MACIFGHKWNGCKCEKCGKVRNEGHVFIPVEGACEEKCKQCGLTREKHFYAGGFCKICGQRAERPVIVESLTDDENSEMIYTVDAYNQHNGFEDHSLMSLALYTMGVFNDCEKKPELIPVCSAARRNLETRQFTPEEAEVIIFSTGKAKELFAKMQAEESDSAKKGKLQERIDHLTSGSGKIQKALDEYREQEALHNA